ncbi:MAG: ATP-binding protein [Bacteroidota bacterium]
MFNESNRIEAQVINNQYYSIGFPNLNTDEYIKREQYIHQIKSLLDSGNEIIFVDGEEDSGKTSLCAQYANKHGKNCITIFFNPNNSLDFDMAYFCANFINQAKNILGEEIDENQYYTIEDYRKLNFPLRKYLKKGRSKITLVIDGIEKVMDSQASFIKEMFSNLPLGDGSFQIIFSGKYNNYCAKFPNLERFNSNIQSISLPGFSASEMTTFLNTGDLSSSEIEDLYKVTKGLPGRLKLVKRLLKKNDFLLSDLSSVKSYALWLEKDCDSINLGNDKENKITSLLSLSGKIYSKDEVANICCLDKDEVEVFVKDNPIFEYSENKVRFCSNSHRRYFANQLRANKNNVDELLIQYYAKDKRDIFSNIERTRIHARLKQWDKVIEVLDDDYLPKIIEFTGSLQQVNDSLKIGLQASQNMNKYKELWRFSFQASIVNELDNYEFWESEVIARISLQDFAGAIDLASTAVLSVDRLRLFALIARKQKELKKTVDEELITLIQDLYASTDIYILGEKIYDVVANLLYAIPNLAIEIIEKSSQADEDADINDWILTKLSLAAIDSNNKATDDDDGEKKVQAVERLNEKEAKKINKAIAFLVGDYTSKKVIDEVRKLSEPKEKLRLIRIWLNNKRNTSKDFEKVINLGLDEIIKLSSEESITFETLKDFTIRLPYIKNPEEKHKLLNRLLKIQKDTVDIGTSISKFIYLMNIFHTKSQLTPALKKKTLNEIIQEAQSINDNSVKLDAFSEIYSKISILHDGDLRKTCDFIYAKIIELSKELFAETANHFRIIRHTLKTIGNKNPILGLKLCENINAINRKENAKLYILDSYLNNNIKHIKIDLIEQIERSLTFQSSKNELYVALLDRYSEANSLPYEVVKRLLPFIGEVKNINEIRQRLRGHVLSYEVLSKNSRWSERMLGSMGKLILNSLDNIESEWDQADLGFKISAELSKINPEFSRLIFDRTSAIKNSSWLYSTKVANTYILSIKIIIRAYSGLLASNKETKEHYDVLSGLINRISSEEERLLLWTEVGFLSITHEKENIRKEILENHILPIVVSLESKGTPLQSISLSLVFLHVSNPGLSEKYIESIQEEYKDSIYRELIKFYITKRSPFEYYDQEIPKYNSGFGDFIKALDIIAKLRNDFNISGEVRELTTAIKKTVKNIAPAQLRLIIDRLNSMINQKLPDGLNIKHDGYKILAKARVLTIKRKDIEHNLVWSELLSEIERIPNLSDKILVKSAMLEMIPFDRIKDKEMKRNLYESIVTKIKVINTHYEFVHRVIDITDIMHKVNKLDWESIINEAFTLSGKLKNGNEALSSQKAIIDTMHKLNPAYAKTLIQSLDKVNKRENLNKAIQNHYDTLIVSDKIKNNIKLEDKDKAKTYVLNRAVFSALTSLNSNKTPPKKVGEISNLLSHGTKASLHENYPILSYYLANCSKTYKTTQKTGKVKDIHENNFNEAVKAAQLIQVLSITKQNKVKSKRQFFADSDFSTNYLLRPNSREDALDYIRTWIKDNAQEFIIIADPYFTKVDLEILHLIQQLGLDEIRIDILGSENGWDLNLENSFSEYWNEMSDIEPPFTNLTFCWIPEKGNSSPFHDRFIITKDNGLSLGTSINAIGLTKESVISVMKPSDTLKVYQNSLSEYINRFKKILNNQRIKYKAFSL